MHLNELNPLYEKIIEQIQTSGFAICDDFFDESTINRLQGELFQKLENNSFKEASIGNNNLNQIAKSIRADNIFWINESLSTAAEKIFFDKINHFVNYLNKHCFTGISSTEFHYAHYPTGAFYKKHLDVFNSDNSRKFSVILYLNSEQWHPCYGGALKFYFKDESLEILPQPGRFVVFESRTLEHEVLKVHKERFSITGWLKTKNNKIL